MESSPVTDSAELHIPRDLLLSTAPDAVTSTSAKDVHGLKWHLDWYRRRATEPNTSDLFVICLRVSPMPVKCGVKYTIADISETYDGFCLNLIEPVIFSISRDVLIQKTGDDDLTFKCEVTFTHVPKAISIPAQVDLFNAHCFTDTITLVIRQTGKCKYESPKCPIDKNGKMVWSMVGYKVKGTKAVVYMQTSAAYCTVNVTYEYGNCIFVQENMNAAKPTAHRCVKTLDLHRPKSPDDVLVIKCTALFIFKKPIERESQPVSTKSKSTDKKGVTVPLKKRNTKRTSVNNRKVNVSIPLLLPLSSESAIIFDSLSSPEGITWALEVPPFKKGKQIRVCLCVSRTPIYADVIFIDPIANITKRTVVIIQESESPKLVIEIRYKAKYNKPFNGTCEIQFLKLTDDATSETNSEKTAKKLPKVSIASTKSVNQTNDDNPSDGDTSADEFFDAVSFQSEQSQREIEESCQSSDDAYETPAEDVTGSDIEDALSEDSDDTSEYTSSKDGDGSDEEDGMTDQERLAYRLRRQNEETIAVQKLLAKIKNVPMIAEGSTF